MVTELQVLEGGGASKADVAECIRQGQQREKAWVSRKRAKVADEGKWQQRKRHRKAAWIYSCMLNHQLHTLTMGAVNLLYWMQPVVLAERAHWSTWPLLSISPDMGSEDLYLDIQSSRRNQTFVNKLFYLLLMSALLLASSMF